MVFPWIPTKELNKLQVNITHEVQSHACIDTIELQQAKDNRDEMELVFNQAKLDTKEERERVKGLEKKVVVAYEKIPKDKQTVKLIMTKNIDHVA